jgi:hypothetical protein
MDAISVDLRLAVIRPSGVYSLNASLIVESTVEHCQKMGDHSEIWKATYELKTILG